MISRGGECPLTVRDSCQLCDKRFDRPSTLKKVCSFFRSESNTKTLTAKPRIAYVGPHRRKRYSPCSVSSSPLPHSHTLSHTCRKRVIGHHYIAWACEICGRRFSVSSNLNRHVRRCKEKWAKSDSLATDTPPILSDPSEHTESPPSSSSPSSSDGSDPCSPSSPQQMIHRRQSVPGPVTDHGPRSHDQHHVAGKPQRRRRKGSPVEPWVPASLVNFNLEPITRSVPTPLPAVVPSMFEERNSYADTPSQAYHPSCWTGRLVGPSYVPRNEEVSGGRIYGKLLVF